MDQGVVAEVGSYEELMSHDGAFAKFMKTYLTEQHSDDSDSDEEGKLPASILHKFIAGRYRPVSYPDGPIRARYQFIKNAYWADV